MGWLRKHGLVASLVSLLSFQAGGVDLVALGHTVGRVIDAVKGREISSVATPATFPDTSSIPPIVSSPPVVQPTEVFIEEKPQWAIDLENKFEQQCGSVYNYITAQ
jgi:hypothetical protein